MLNWFRWSSFFRSSSTQTHTKEPYHKPLSIIKLSYGKRIFLPSTCTHTHTLIHWSIGNIHQLINIIHSNFKVFFKKTTLLYALMMCDKYSTPNNIIANPSNVLLLRCPTKGTHYLNCILSQNGKLAFKENL